ncbi:hypothetical protein Gogos_019072 [Gossypium gossypioides]|uniref:Uncharacterized protein n=1 Tax=Gossypium gossypioides TaxID=34282 RepID=A0A7J9BG94_GOSGO|nr:hypothetical protein [Gossypium gossypioides]
MTKLECDNKNRLKAQYNYCKSIFSTKSSSETSHLRFHLNSCLKKINRDITQYTIATQSSLGCGLSIKTYKFDDDECHVLDYWGQQYKDYQIFALFDEEWINALCKPFLTILNSYLMSMLGTPNPRLPLWPRVPMFRIMILLILVCINSMLIGLIWEEIMIRVMIINDT